MQIINYYKTPIMTNMRFFILLAFLSWSNLSLAQNDYVIEIEWRTNPSLGSFTVDNGSLKSLQVTGGEGTTNMSEFQFMNTGKGRIKLIFDDFNLKLGSYPTIVSLKANEGSFSFFLRDITIENPVFIPEYGVVVLKEDDRRTYAEVEKEILSKKLKNKLDLIEDSPEEASFESVENRVRNMSVPTWLGVSRDFRIFQINESLSDMSPGEANIITPMRSSSQVTLEERDNRPSPYLYSIGRGVGVQDNITRRLEQGTLPILNSKLVDDEVEYYTTSFVSFETSPLISGGAFGTDFLVSDSYSGGHMFTDEQKKQVDEKRGAEINREEETVLYIRSQAVNTGNVPRYAWFKAPRPGSGWYNNIKYNFDRNTGLSFYDSGRVFCVSKINGLPLHNEEIAVLLQPMESVVVEFYVPHSPIDSDNALALFNQSFEHRLNEARTFWMDKLRKAATIKLPEKRIEEMIQAGLLHLDLITFGKDPDETLSANIGVYSPIGTESSPIIQFYNSMGWQDVARRSINYFLDKQHESGFIQNFGGYMVETGAALWTMGEYFRYTKDEKWVNQNASRILKSVDYLLQWRNRNKREELRGRGYGMIEGKVADPEDHFRQFMLNGYAYLGMSRVAEILEAVGHSDWQRVRKEADDWKNDIRESFFNVMALSPVVPLGDGSWSPTAPPWTEYVGLRSLYARPEVFWSHGTVTVSDAMLGPLYLAFCEVLDVDEPATRMLLDYHSELFFQGNAAFSQPYYSRHNWIQAKLGMTKPFLETYYTTFAATSDRDTYSFWEHLYKVSPHKTHEEAWFLMETRWMLYMEDGDQLDLFKTIPRVWMADGERILLDGVWSYFGPIRVEATSNVNSGHIDASIECSTDRKPSVVRVRLPHPENKKPVKVIGGTYDEKTETVIVSDFNGTASVRLVF